MKTVKQTQVVLFNVLKKALKESGYYNLDLSRDENGIYVQGKGTYYARHELREIGGEFDREMKAWFIAWDKYAQAIVDRNDTRKAVEARKESAPAPAPVAVPVPVVVESAPVARPDWQLFLNL